MLELLRRNWWMIALRGVVGVLFGICAFAWPHLTLAILVGLFGVYAIAEGGLSIATAIRHREETPHWGALLAAGIVSVLAGIFAWVMPGITTVALVYIIAAWAFVTGVLGLVATIKLRRVIEGEWMLMLSAAASIALGGLLFARPGAGALALVWLIGVYAIVFGGLLIGLGFSVRGHGRSVPPHGLPA